MDDQIFGGTPTEPNEPEKEENAVAEEITEEQHAGDDTVTASDHTDEQKEEEKEATEAAPVGEYHYNKEQYNNHVGQNPPPSQYQPYNQYQNRPNYYQGNSQQVPPPGSYNYYTQNAPYSQQGQPYRQNPTYNQYSNPSSQPPKKKNTGMKVFIAIICAIVALSVALIVALFAANNDDGNKVLPGESGVTQNADNKGGIDNVGSIDITDGSNNMGDAVNVANVAKQFNVGILIYSRNQLYTEGSGVIVKEDDEGKYTYIVTCAHVVNYSGIAISVLMEDGTEYPADLVGMDTRTDLAVVRIEASGLPKAKVADSDKLVVGQTVYAVGNPGGSEFFGSVTNGIISAIDRPVSSSTGYEMECIQHTSAINPGNSGGALVNGEGQLIGINSMKIASTEYEGMGFAVPSSVVIDVFDSIIENGYVSDRAKLGIQYTTPSNYSQTYAMYVQMKGLPSGTIVIASINEDSELVDKDVKVGDMIVAVNGTEMKNTDMLSEMIENMSVGDTITLKIVRVNSDDWSQTESDVTVKLVEDKGTSATTPTPDSGSSGSGSNPYGDQYQDWYEFFKDFYGY